MGGARKLAESPHLFSLLSGGSRGGRRMLCALPGPLGGNHWPQGFISLCTPEPRGTDQDCVPRCLALSFQDGVFHPGQFSCFGMDAGGVTKGGCPGGVRGAGCLTCCWVKPVGAGWASAHQPWRLLCSPWREKGGQFWSWTRLTQTRAGGWGAGPGKGRFQR